MRACESHYISHTKSANIRLGLLHSSGGGIAPWLFRSTDEAVLVCGFAAAGKETAALGAGYQGAEKRREKHRQSAHVAHGDEALQT
jgi:hypothetical protein